MTNTGDRIVSGTMMRYGFEEAVSAAVIGDDGQEHFRGIRSVNGSAVRIDTFWPMDGRLSAYRAIELGCSLLDLTRAGASNAREDTGTPLARSLAEFHPDMIEAFYERDEGVRGSELTAQVREEIFLEQREINQYPPLWVCVSGAHGFMLWRSPLIEDPREKNRMTFSWIHANDTPAETQDAIADLLVTTYAESTGDLRASRIGTLVQRHLNLS